MLDLSLKLEWYERSKILLKLRDFSVTVLHHELILRTLVLQQQAGLMLKENAKGPVFINLYGALIMAIMRIACQLVE